VTDSGLPSDDTLAERIAAADAAIADHSERVARIAQAFTKLPSAVSGKDIAELLTDRFEHATYGTLDLTLAELEAISLRIAERNSLVMQNVLTDADIEEKRAAVRAREDKVLEEIAAARAAERRDQLASVGDAAVRERMESKRPTGDRL
jgi:hypothetical protein